MKLTYFTAGDPFQVTEFPFDDMYITDAKFIKLAIKDDQWLGIIKGDYTKYIEESTLRNVESIDGFINFQTNMQITKAEIINAVYSHDVQIKIIRDNSAGRNKNIFKEFDTFVQLIPSAGS